MPVSHLSNQAEDFSKIKYYSMALGAIIGYEINVANSEEKKHTGGSRPIVSLLLCFIHTDSLSPQKLLCQSPLCSIAT